MTVDVNTIENFMSSLIPFVPGTQHCYLVANLMKRCGFLPNTGIQRDRRIFDDDEYFSIHRCCRLQKLFESSARFAYRDWTNR